jgi:hypothetical protein
MRRFRFGLVAAVLLLLPPARALAWNSVGHMAVDKLAYDQMDRDLKAKLAALLSSTRALFSVAADQEASLLVGVTGTTHFPWP